MVTIITPPLTLRMHVTCLCTLKQTFVFPLNICRQHHGTGVSSPATVVTSGGSPEGVVSQPSDQSGVERAV